MGSVARPANADSQTFQATGIAKDTQGNEMATFNPVNNFQGNQEIEITFTNTGTDHAERSDFGVIPKITASSPGTLPAGLTVSGTYTWAQWLELLKRENFYVTEMRIQTDDTSHFSGNLKMGETRFDNVDVPETVNLSKYRVSVGNGYSDVITVKDKGFLNKARFFLVLSKIKDGKSISFYFKVGAEGAPPVTQVK